MSNIHLTKFVEVPEPNKISSINLNSTTKLNLGPVLQQVLLDENLIFLRVYTVYTV